MILDLRAALRLVLALKVGSYLTAAFAVTLLAFLVTAFSLFERAGAMLLN